MRQLPEKDGQGAVRQGRAARYVLAPSIKGNPTLLTLRVSTADVGADGATELKNAAGDTLAVYI